ncbi:LysM peptidoglycan-binding domain-containing protein [Cellvibrio sp. pealriver]|uniref:lytic transglycosylase n=1 Tax=Cellvibrio sp. pealriver TaxID=1622269 RepID=UPI00066FE27B|nr:LysM peptidoglycan-binding domain-containing protein [Cellvibrio sp. pealriver]
MKPQNRSLLLPFCLCLSLLLMLAGCSSLNNPKEPVADAIPADVQHVEPEESPLGAKLREHTGDYGNLWDEITDGYNFPEISDAKVDKNLRWLSNNQRYLDRVTEQSKPYLYYVANELRENGLPMELALLPIVESAYDPFASSPSKALGVWQFMPHTGRNFGLKQNHWYDGRRDIVASTDAAVRYLKRLNTMFDGDWLLTIAAYNAGEGTIRRAIQRNRKQGKGTDFWSLPLSQQTQSYVPQLLALSKVIANPEKYDLELTEIPNNPYFTTVNVSSPIDLAQAARMADINPKDLRNLNAGYNKWITDPTGPHQLLVPVADAAQFTLSLDKLPKITPIQVAGDYKVKSGDTLGAIAKRFGTSVAAIQSANNLKNTQLKIGQSLSIPGQAPMDSPYAIQAEQEIAQRKQKNTGTYYTVASGDSFWTIARKNKTTVNNLLKWNELSANAKLKPGQKLLVLNKTTEQKDGNKITYQIKSGDTLHKIANKFDVSKKDILSWNKVKNESYIHPGQELTIYLSAKN